MLKKGFLLAMILLFASAVLFAGGSKDKEEKKQFIQIKSSVLGGTWYAAGSVWAKLISDNTKYIATNAASPGLTNESITRMLDGTAQLAVVDGLAVNMAVKGEGEWKKPVTEIRAMFGLWTAIHNIIVLEKSGINDIYGLKGKNVATYVEGEPDGEAFMELMAMHGVTPQNTRILRIMKNDATRMMIDGKLDCMVFAFGHGHANLKELTASRAIKFIFGDMKHIDPWLKKYPVYYVEKFGKEFAKEDANQFAGPYFMICLASMPDEQAYLFTKVWWENYKYVKETLPAGLPWSEPQNNMNGVPVPIHPGAAKYFKEIGAMK